MNKKELKNMRDTVNNVSRRFSWCENYAAEELKMIFKILDTFGVDWTCTEDRYFWMNGEPTTKNQVYRIEKDGEVLETVLIVDRYYGSDFNNSGHCELNCYLA